MMFRDLLGSLAGSRIFVTGASGLLGRAALRHLPVGAVRVGALCRRRPPGLDVESWLPVDLEDLDTLGRSVGLFRPDLILHLGAAVGDRLEEVSTHRINVEATRVLSQYVEAHPATRLVVASTVLVAGLDNLIGADESIPFTRRPMIAYVRSKIAMEEELLAGSERRNVRILRFPRLYGPGEERVLPGLLRALEGGRLVMIDGGRKLQSFLHVEDAVQALFRAATLEGPCSRVFNICDGARVENRRIFEVLARAAGLEPPRRSVPFFLALALAHVASLRARTGLGESPPLVTPFRVHFFGRHHHYSIERARRELGYFPGIDLERGLPAVVASLVPTGRT